MKVEEMQRKLSEKAERVKDHRFDNLYSLICQKEWLERAYWHIQSNRGNATAGVDGVRRGDFENDLQRHLTIIQKELKAETFTPLPVRRTYVLKKNGRRRPIGVTALRDKVVQEALRMVLEPIYEADFSSRSYGVITHGF
jgi:RNA-directed DNA polymerase